MQKYLEEKGHLASEPTGFFGVLTTTAVISFQNANGIVPASGYVGAETKAKIKEVSCVSLLPLEPNENPALKDFEVPTDFHAGQVAHFNFNANDKDGDDLFWSVDFGDGETETLAACSLKNLKKSKNWSYDSYHAWKLQGVYVVNVSVTDCKSPGAIGSFQVNIKDYE